MLREITARDRSFPAFLAALQAAELAIEDLHAEPFRYFTLDDLAWGGLGAGEDALLRSLVVLPHARGQGLGQRVVAGLIHAAREQRAQRLWLLTTTAASFFENLGWRRAERAAAPSAIARSRQFTSLCPASAALMTYSV